MKDLGDLMKQAGEMQAKMQEMQAQMAEMEATGASGGGLVSVTLTGKGQATKVTIDKTLMDPEETEILEDLIAAAINDAKAKTEQAMQDQMKEMTAGLPLPPGFKLPF